MCTLVAAVLVIAFEWAGHQYAVRKLIRHAGQPVEN